ncbi:MAG: hypothetical protein H7Y31_01190 [Chitinophagaceae bacterium]|nr:hypothetical protein [Chitinophagaceae bacterium]
MYRLHIPFADLLIRLIKLNEDRESKYAFFAKKFEQSPIKEKFLELSYQSHANLSELSSMLPVESTTGYSLFSVSQTMWHELDRVKNQSDLQRITTIIYRIEDQYAILYRFICNMLRNKETNVTQTINAQFHRLMKSRSMIPHLLAHCN